MDAWRLYLLAGTFLAACSLAVLSYAPDTLLSTTTSVSLLQRFIESSKMGSTSLSSLGIPQWRLASSSLREGAPNQVANISSKMSLAAGNTDRSAEEGPLTGVLIYRGSSSTSTALLTTQGGGPTATLAAGAPGDEESVSSAGSAADFSEDSPEMQPSDDIPGSRLKPGEEVRAFRRRWECLLSTGAAHWALDPHPRELPWPRTRSLGICGEREGYAGPWSNLGVTNGTFTEDHWPVAESLKYVWEARSREVCGAPAPSFTNLDGRKFCSGLQKTKGSFFIVGDSLSDNFFQAVLSQLELVGVPTVSRTPSVECREFGVDVYLANPETAPSTRLLCTNVFICGKHWGQGALLMHFARSLHLGKLLPNSSAQERLFGSLLDVPELAWGREAKRYKGSVILLNRGAHFVASGGHSGFEAQLNYTLRELRRMLPNALIVFRSTPAGHPNCTLHSRPIESPLNVTEWPYNWDKFDEQNWFAKRLVESVGGVFFDVQPMTSLRPDWHVEGPRGDCLHHCRPGPVDDWVKAFARMLEELL